MFGRLVQKELRHHLLDFRFVAVFAFCALLSALSVYMGVQGYTRQLREYSAVSENNRRAFQEKSIDQGRLFDLYWYGYQWNRRPEVLSLVVFGLAGSQGREAFVGYQNTPLFEASIFETDPIHALFEVLDLAFVVKVVLSLCVLLFTYDAVCGEKESGTLRLYSSFPVSRSVLALAKLVGSTLAILAPLVFAFLLASAVLALSPGVGLGAEDWIRIAVLMGVFALYLMVFSAFGLFVSALTHRRMTAFLGLLGLWTVWVFVVPNLAVDVARRLVPVQSYYGQQKEELGVRWKIKTGGAAEMRALWERTRVEDWDALSEAQREQVRRQRSEGGYQIGTRWDRKYFSDLRDLNAKRRNRMRSQQRTAMALSAVSPFGAVSFLSTDLARTGFVQQERLEDALNGYLIYLAGFIHEKRRESGSMFQGADMTGFSWFTHRDTEGIGECLIRNAFHILNLVLLMLVGFAGAYVAILRYDVR